MAASRYSTAYTMNHKYRILSTAPLPQRLIAEAAGVGIALDTVSFIDVQPVTGPAIMGIITELSHQANTVVFTSANAVTAIAPYIKGDVPGWKVYATAPGAIKAIDKHLSGCTIAGTAGNAAALGTQLIADGISNVTFFCSDKRMDTLPLMLAAAGISTNEVIVYNTIETPVALSTVYDAILLFSPSGVSSYLSANVLPAGAALFAIGTTTAAAIYQHTGRVATVSSNPEKESVLNAALLYFQQKAHA